MSSESTQSESELPSCSGSTNSVDNPVDHSDESRRSATIKLINNAVDELIKSVTWKKFKQLYRVVYEKDRETVKSLHKHLQKDMKTRITLEINRSVLTEEFLSSLDRLDELEKAVDKAQKSCSWRPSRNPGKDLAPHLASEKAEEKRLLENALKDLKLRNEKIRQENYHDYQKICEYEQQLQIVESTLKKINGACEKLPLI